MDWYELPHCGKLEGSCPTEGSLGVLLEGHLATLEKQVNRPYGKETMLVWIEKAGPRTTRGPAKRQQNSDFYFLYSCGTGVPGCSMEFLRPLKDW